MPIYLDFSHPNRIVVAVVRGTVTAEDLAAAVRQFIATGALHYRKILDVSSGTSSIDEQGLEALAALMRASPNAASRGPLAFVIDPRRGEIAERFASLTQGERPVKTFRSIHDARRWLDENTKM
jgi:hypothetical protein